MKNLRQNLDDSLRPEYKRSDFGEMIQGKFANTQLEFAELVSLLIASISEEQGVNFIHHSPFNCRAGHKSGEWGYDIDNDNQITLRYWVNEVGNIPERISNPRRITTPQEQSDLYDLIFRHTLVLKSRVATVSTS